MLRVNSRRTKNRKGCATNGGAGSLLLPLLLILCASGNLLEMVAGKVGSSRARYAYNNKSVVDGNNADTAKDLDTDPDTEANNNTNLHLLEEDIDPLPMDFYRQLNNITDISEFIEKFIDPDSLDPKIGLRENLKRNVERAAYQRAQPAKCKPESTVVDLEPLNPKYNFYPRCTRVNRCGGCCNTQWMSCQPTETEVINFQVFRYCFNENHKFCGLEVVPVVQHVECSCDCKIKPEDCNAFQHYQDCRCHCTNDEARTKCLQLEHKTWDDINCRCVCKQNENCTTGSYYDENQCKCMLPLNTSNEELITAPEVFDRRRFIVKPIAVEPDNSTIYKL